MIWVIWIWIKSKDGEKSKNEEFQLPDGSYPVSDIQDYFGNILKDMRQLLIILQ